MLDGVRLGTDTETALVERHEAPQLALTSVSDGRAHYVIHPGRLGEFIVKHQGRHFVAHNAAFDHGVLAVHLEHREEAEALIA